MARSSVDSAVLKPKFPLRLFSRVRIQTKLPPTPLETAVDGIAHFDFRDSWFITLPLQTSFVRRSDSGTRQCLLLSGHRL
jgi:hypothetical protein